MSTRSSIVICATRARVRSVLLLPAFAWHTVQSHQQARAAPGNLRTDARQTGLLTYWTVTAWQDAAALRSYLVEGPHGRAMPRAKFLFDESCVGHWSADSPNADWREVEERLAEIGRLVPVSAPSPAHRAGHRLGSSASNNES